jgi:hypothetical protein
MIERNYIAERIGPLQWIVYEAGATRVLFRSHSRAQAVRVASLLFNACRECAAQHSGEQTATDFGQELLMDMMGHTDDA